jgi:hypothetical protein
VHELRDGVAPVGLTVVHGGRSFELTATKPASINTAWTMTIRWPMKSAASRCSTSMTLCGRLRYVHIGEHKRQATIFFNVQKLTARLQPSHDTHIELNLDTTLCYL